MDHTCAVGLWRRRPGAERIGAERIGAERIGAERIGALDGGREDFNGIVLEFTIWPFDERAGDLFFAGRSSPAP